MEQRRQLTRELAGTGGQFQSSPETFFVEEIPLYEACGDGEHLYVRFEKEGRNTRDVIRRAMQVFELGERDIGYAGLKDKHARTVQTISILGADPARAAELEGDGVRVLSARRHRNKLKTGHLEGNRFRARIDGADEGAAGRAEAILERLSREGLPNYYGDQRFGAGGENVERARAVLRRGQRAAGSRWKARLLVSALQSYLFNGYLARRMDAGAFARVLTGDVLLKEGSGGRFTCEDPAIDQPRYDAWELSVSGPIFGLEMRRPTEDTEPAAWEAAILADAELELDDFRKVRKLAQGTRRPLRARVSDVTVEAGGEGALWVEFTLPSGSYATVVLDEITKGG